MRLKDRTAYPAETIFEIRFRAAPLAALQRDFRRDIAHGNYLRRRFNDDGRNSRGAGDDSVGRRRFGHCAGRLNRTRRLGAVIVESESENRSRERVLALTLRREPLLRRRRIKRRRLRRLRKRSIGQQFDVKTFFANAAVAVRQRAPDNEDRNQQDLAQLRHRLPGDAVPHGLLGTEWSGPVGDVAEREKQQQQDGPTDVNPEEEKRGEPANLSAGQRKAASD